MGVKWKTKKNNLPYIEDSLKSMHGKTVEVGANWANAWLANIHEYG
jgi:hypothetical protein